MNLETKKENGVVFTPEWVASFMVGEILNSQKITGKEKILDAGCGEGVFTTIVAEKFSKISGKPIDKVIEENIYFVDISKEYIEKTKQNLQKLSDKKNADTVEGLDNIVSSVKQEVDQDTKVKMGNILK